MPPEVPATVSDGVVVELATEINPPVKVTDVTVPVVGVAQEGMPAERVKTCPFVPAASIAVVDAPL